MPEGPSAPDICRAPDLILEASIESKTIGCISLLLGWGWPMQMLVALVDVCFSVLPGPKFVHCYWMEPCPRDLYWGHAGTSLNLYQSVNLYRLDCLDNYLLCSLPLCTICTSYDACRHASVCYSLLKQRVHQCNSSPIACTNRPPTVAPNTVLTIAVSAWKFCEFIYWIGSIYSPSQLVAYIVAEYWLLNI